MTGKEKSGYENSHSLLFENSVYILTMNNPESVGSNRLSALIHSLGARVTFLFNNNINIKNMELLKIREGIGGTFRLSFDNKPDCKKAKQIIEQIGFSIKL